MEHESLASPVCDVPAQMKTPRYARSPGHDVLGQKAVRELDGGPTHGSRGAPEPPCHAQDALIPAPLRTLADLLLDQALGRPDATAIASDSGCISYRDLFARAALLARHLRGLGLVGGYVGVYLEPSADLIVVVWGILLSGNAYLPLAPDYPEERLRYMVDDATVGAIVTCDRLAARANALAPSQVGVVSIDGIVQDAAAGNPPDRLPFPVQPHDLAYVIYTSGSTGKPKGVMIEQHSIAAQMRWLGAQFGLDASSRILQKTSMSFDAAQWEILAAACGATVVVGKAGIHRDPEQLIGLIKRHGVTCLQAVPTLLQALLDTVDFPTCRSLTHVFSGGEVLSHKLARQILDEAPHCQLINLYGPTECTINTSSYRVDAQALLRYGQAMPIGYEVSGVGYHILDEDRRPVADGQTGELYIAGGQLARGYLQRPALTEEKFVQLDLGPDLGIRRLYRTGDVAFRNADGSYQFAGRTDRQVKLRGYRVELGEVQTAIEAHDWVKRAAVVLHDDQRTGQPCLVACVELNPREAMLMDQGNHGAHHQSKRSKLQVKAQLSDHGCRDAADVASRAAVQLPGMEPTAHQRRRVFARKTYRFFEGGSATRQDVERLLCPLRSPPSPSADAALDLQRLGTLLRYFGQYHSSERLLPKYGYASPGALYATQIYIALQGVADAAAGLYYYHPAQHRLLFMTSLPDTSDAACMVHLMGKKQAIEPVYRNNIQEVLEFEAGHIIGLFDEVLPEFGRSVGPIEHVPAVAAQLDCAPDDYYLASFTIAPASDRSAADPIDLFVQSHPGKVADLPAGMYRVEDDHLVRVGDELVLKKHVIAINQQTYERASFGISMVSRTPDTWRSYIDLGRKLQRLQMNDCGFGFMSSGYSSKSGNDLQSAVRIGDILASLGQTCGASYFCVGGRVSDEQRASEGMGEDVVHMRGPAELIKADLASKLPQHMVPARLMIWDGLPLTANGKLDVKELESALRRSDPHAARTRVEARTATEARLAQLWSQVMHLEQLSMDDDFFDLGGNSLTALSLVARINKTFGLSLPVQVLFESPTLEGLASEIDRRDVREASRLLRLHAADDAAPIYCWPGLGGYPMNLKELARRLDAGRSFFGVQALGINEGELPASDLAQMAAQDLRLIRAHQPHGPYTLWGYSFGARVAHEAARQLEAAGECVQRLFLIAPGAPRVAAHDVQITEQREPPFDDLTFVAILFSVFSGTTAGPMAHACLREAVDEDRFVAFIAAMLPHLECALIRRIVSVVRHTYAPDAAFFRGCDAAQLAAPITVLRACSDADSFIEVAVAQEAASCTLIRLRGDHYGLLRTPGVDELVTALRVQLGLESPAHAVAFG